MTETQQAIATVIAGNAKLRIGADALALDTDLYEAGMTSHASVTVMLALEDHFDLEFPDRMLTRDVFASIAAIDAAVGELTSAPEPV
ncbi:MAG: acyl carrier protein [Baekduia sp.]